MAGKLRFSGDWFSDADTPPVVSTTVVETIYPPKQEDHCARDTLRQRTGMFR